MRGSWRATLVLTVLAGLVSGCGDSDDGTTEAAGTSGANASEVTLESLTDCIGGEPRAPNRFLGSTIQEIVIGAGVKVLLVELKDVSDVDGIAARYEKKPGWEVFRTSNESILAVLASSREGGAAVSATRFVVEDCAGGESSS